MRLRGHVSLKQSDFGMQPYTAMLGAIGVADQLELYGEAYIVKEGNIPPPVAPARRRSSRRVWQDFLARHVTRAACPDIAGSLVKFATGKMPVP